LSRSTGSSFKTGPIDANGQDDLKASINELADRIDSGHPSPLVTVLSRNLRQLGQVSPRDMARLQQEWIRIRDGLFNDASWYRRSSSDPVAWVHTAEGAADTKQLKRAMLARQKRLDESYANVDTAFRFFMRGS
jgi:hypothetical protein